MRDQRGFAVVAVIARWWVLGSGAAILTLGALFWSGNALALEPVHEVLALTLVLALLVLSVLGAVTGAPTRMWVMGLVWVVLVPALGIGQLLLYGLAGNAIAVNAIRSL